MSSFTKLDVWQLAYALSLKIDAVAQRIGRKHPRLADQVERAAESIPAAIAEGRGRATDRDFAHYCTIAIGSANELENHLFRVADLSLVAQTEVDSLTANTIQVRKMLIGLRKRLLMKQPKPKPKPESREPEVEP